MAKKKADEQNPAPMAGDHDGHGHEGDFDAAARHLREAAAHFRAGRWAEGVRCLVCVWDEARGAWDRLLADAKGAEAKAASAPAGPHHALADECEALAARMDGHAHDPEGPGKIQPKGAIDWKAVLAQLIPLLLRLLA